MRSDLTQEIHVVQIQQPVCIVYHQRLTVREIDKLLHLLFEALAIVLDLFFCQHLTHIGLSGGIAHHTGTAANQSDGFVSCHLETFHQTQCHEMSYMKAVCCRIKSNVKYCFSVVDQITYHILVRYLGDEASGL